MASVLITRSKFLDDRQGRTFPDIVIAPEAIGVLVRMIMEKRGWRKSGRKGSFGVRASGLSGKPTHNTGGLAFCFIRAERYQRVEGAPFRSVRERCREFETAIQHSAPSETNSPHSTGSTG